tara:strand:+ start:194225 stop:195160 length:936 start_codon:yes stop_codon:yes gene_type:complete
MKINYLISHLFLGLLLASCPTFAQEIETEDSAEVFLEEYSDTFQETFFEALKQKGIENYDKAINLLLECKKIDPSKKVVDYELAKVYQETKMYAAALESALNAVNANPENYWYVSVFVDLLQLNRSTIDTLKDQVPNDNLAFKENLASVYYQTGNYNAAMAILKTLKSSVFTDTLNAKLKDLKRQEENTETLTYSSTTDTKENEDSTTIEGFKNNIENIISTKDYVRLDSVSNEALENFPAQPYFYYARGLALNKKNKFREAVRILEASLDYMLDDIPLENKIYKELYEAYSGLNNPEKANEYLRKVNPGF